MLRGGCFCGRVRYEARGEPFHSTLCHCADCRRASGAPAVAWFSVAAADLRFTAGQPRTFASSAGNTRTFCGDCGTPLVFRGGEAPDEVDVTACSLDHPELVPPADHTWDARRLPWLHLADALPRHRQTRGKG